MENNAFQSISVDEVIANIFEEEETQVGIEEVEEEVLFFIDDDSDADGTDVIEIYCLMCSYLNKLILCFHVFLFNMR